MTDRRPETPAPVPGDVVSRVAAHYDANTWPFYLDRWHPEDIHFGLFAPGQDERDHHPAVKAMTRRVVSPARIVASDLVVDAGCGVGGTALDLARDPGAQVVGLSISQVQLELARKRAEETGLANRARFEWADCCDPLPFDDASVDVVVTMEAACHFADKPAFLRECLRILKPGGRLSGTDWMATDSCTEPDYADYLEPVCEAWHLTDLRRPSEWSGMLARAGFHVHECVDLAEAVTPNARILARARLNLMLEVTNGSHSPDRARLWQAQYDTLLRAWFERRFTLGCLLAVRPE